MGYRKNKNQSHQLFLLVIFSLLSTADGFSQHMADSTTPAIATLKKLSIEQLLNMEVTSVSKRSEKLNEAASAIQVITNEAIRRSGATSVPEALRLASNLQVARVNSSQWAISARGFNNVLANKLLVLIDGRTVYTPLYAGVFWDVQNLLLEDVERIEVISGPGGTLWGANAVNGVINIITKSAQDTQGALVEGGIGSDLQYYGGVRYGGKISNDISYRLYGTAFKRGSTFDQEKKDSGDEWTMAQGGFQLDWTKEENHLMLQSNLYDDRPNPDGNAEKIKAKGSNILGRWTHSFSEKSDIKLQLYFDQTRRDFRNDFKEKLNTYDLDGQHRFSIGNAQEIIWGFGYRLLDHSVDNLELFRFEPGQKRLHVYNVFLQDQIALIRDRLKLIVGSKLEHNSYTGLKFQPTVRLSLNLLENHVLWSAVSQAFRNPVRIDRDFFLYATPEIPIITGNDNFKSEKLVAYELGWRMVSKSRFTVSLATFYNSYNHLRSAEPGPPPLNLPITFENGVEGNTFGVEFSGTYQPIAWWRVRGGYTYLEKNLTVKETSKDLNGGSVESNDPNHQFLVQSMMDLPGKVEVDFVIRYVDVLPSPRVPAYWGLDVRLAWRPTKVLEFDLLGQNLVDGQHLEFIPSSPSPRTLERSIFGKIVCRF